VDAGDREGMLDERVEVGGNEHPGTVVQTRLVCIDLVSASSGRMSRGLA
jgi:hypothetical protein